MAARRTQPTLGQATGGRPGRVPAAPATRAAAPRAPAAVPTPRPPTAGPLGLGLGLNPRQRGAFQQAAQQGQGASYLGQTPGLARRVNALNPTGWRAQNVQNFIGSQGQPQPRPGAAPAPAAAAPAPIPQPPMQPAPPPTAMGGGLPGLNAGGYGFNPYGGGMGGGGMAGLSPAMNQILQARAMGYGNAAYGGGIGGGMGYGGGGMGPWGMAGGSMGQFPQGGGMYGGGGATNMAGMANRMNMYGGGGGGGGGFAQLPGGNAQNQAGTDLGQQQQNQARAGGSAV